MDFSTDLDIQPRRVIEVTPDNKRPLWQKILFFVILLLAAGAAIYGITSFLSREDSNSTSKEKDTSAKKTSTESAQVATGRCKPKQDLDNLRQGYQACFSEGWKMKEIKVSGLEIGLYKSEVSNSFPGNINITITDQSEELFTQNASNTSSKFEFGKVNIDGRKSSQVVVTRQKDNPTYPRAIITATTVNSRTYVFTLNSTEVDFAADTAIYEEFLGTVEFQNNISKPPWSESRNILVDQPWSGDSVESPVTISGRALSFEAVVNIRIKDKGGKTLTETTVKTESGTERSAFIGNITFDKGSATEGTIEVYNTASSDESEQDKVTIPVKFK